MMAQKTDILGVIGGDVETIALPNGHVVIPLEIYRRLGIEAGMRLEVEFDKRNGCICLRRVDNTFTHDSRLKEPALRKQKPKSQSR